MKFQKPIQNNSLPPSQLPNELLTLISTTIFPQDRHACMNVCNSWRTAFYHLSFLSVRIYTRRHLCTFIKDIVQSMTPKYSLGDCVREIHIVYKIGVSQQNLRQLEFLCPGLEILDFNPKLWTYLTDYKPIGTSWKSLCKLPAFTSIQCAQTLAKRFRNSLIYLDFDGKMINNLSFKVDILPLLQLLPCLTDLNLTGSFTQLSLEIYEQMHNVLPHLQSLLLNGFLLTLTGDKLSIAQSSTLVFKTLRKLSLTVYLESPIWFLILLKRYPKLESFEANINYDQAYFEQDSYSEAREAFMFAATQWNCLSQFRLSGIIYSMWPGKDFLKCLSNSGSRLKIYKVTYHNNNEQMDEDAFSDVIRYMQNSMTCLSLSFSSAADYIVSNTSIVTKRLCSLVALTDLNLSSKLSGHLTIFNIDTVLNDCPFLTKLSIQGGSIITNDKYLSTEHPLKALDMSYICIASNVFKQISRRCLGLDEIFLSHCIKQYDHTDSLSFLIDMPGQEFSSIKINNLSTASDLPLTCHPGSTIFSLTRLYGKKGRQSIRWYYQIYSNRNKRLRRLNTKKIKTLQEYIQPMSPISMPVPYTRWKQFERSLWCGHVDIRCRSVKRLIINDVLV
ncbi:hypothetical protein CLU79DRAFT_60951 [Phycomyces nitens]|nr:hypothetical protein CLU79DRAFT_60951 [Phycomyces nitens]